jgi:hypothetical protein
MAWIGSSPNQTTQRTDGLRTGTAVHADQKTASVKIRADFSDVELNDIVDMIDDCLKKDGGNLNADIPMNSNKFTGVDNAAARDQFAAAGQVQDSALISATTSGNDTITASLTPAITAYVTGGLYVLKAGGTNTGAGTLNLNTVGAKDIKKGKAGSLNLSAGDFAAGRMGLFAFDGTNMQMLNAPEFPSGTVMLFKQTAAPTGWTKDTSNNNNSAVRIVTGTPSTGGTVDFTTAFTSKTPSGTIGGTAITVNQMPLHGHAYRLNTNSGTVDSSGGMCIRVGNSFTVGAFTGSPSNTAGEQIGGTGGGATHDHSFTGDAIDFAVKYVDVIQATKD